MNCLKRLRVSYRYQDDAYLYVLPAEAMPEEGGAPLLPRASEEEPLRVRYNLAGVNDEFADTCRLLWRGAQLNLLDVEIEADGALAPAFLILEPDYLLDISSLAECFREYGSHPLNYLLARLRSDDNTAPLLVGNIANLFLDEWVHAGAEAPDYKACMQKAFRRYALELAACPDLMDAAKERQFFADCRLHFEHIRRTVTDTFRAPDYDLDKSDALLEPSYICEALGLQGRLDYMQRDMSAFIEMKSGKADEFAIRGKVLPRENNRIQMLLYQAVLEYAMGRDHRLVRAYLLYTRYPLLYPAPPSWAEVRRVMNVRNRIVAMEYGVRLHNRPDYTASILARLTPERLNERGISGKLWHNYLAPQIAAIGTRLATLTELEQKYFHTLYNFITRELYTAKAGDTDYDAHTVSASSLWRCSLEEKCAAGEILYDLTMSESRAGEAHRPTITFSMSGKWLPLTTPPNFRQGDAILLYQRNTSIDTATNQLVFKGNIERLTDTELTIRLRAAQQNPAALPPDSRYAVEHDNTMDTSFRSMYQGLAAFLKATPQRRALLLGQRLPEHDTAFDAAIATATDDFARITLKARAARDYFLLVGPPGTGKTSRALRSMVESFHGEGSNLLLLSYTNRAVDEMCKMLTAITPAVDFIRIGSELACDPAYRSFLIENVLTDCCTRTDVRTRIERCRIFVGTVATLSAHTDLFRLKQFDVALIDEATQILEPQLLGLLSLDAIRKFILIGDHKQLPAVILQPADQTEVHDEALRAIGLRNLKDSLFERLYHSVQQFLFSNNSQLSTLNSQLFYDMLTRQGRMHPAIACYANTLFYENKLQAVGLPHQLDTAPFSTNHSSLTADHSSLLTQRVAFLPAATPLEEARTVARLAADLYHGLPAADFDARHTLGIITPFRTQIALIRRELAATGIPALQDILVDTVERFQGSERDIILYSFCVDSPTQFRFLCNLTEENGVQIDRKLNVALTRARKQLFLTGNPDLLRLNPIYAALLDMTL